MLFDAMQNADTSPASASVLAQNLDGDVILGAKNDQSVSTPAALEIPAPIFAGLRSMMLCDSHKESRVLNMRLDQSAAITGDNGVGKTSLLRPILLFWGVPHTKILPPQNGSQMGFHKYYLPRTHSSIAFEYNNHAGEVRSVVFTAKSDGTIMGQFLRCELREDLFIEEVAGQKRFLSVGERQNKIDQLGGSYSRPQSTSVVRKTLYGEALTKEQANLFGKNAAPQDFALVRRGHQEIKNLAIVAESALYRKTTFEDLLKMAALCFNEGENQEGEDALSPKWQHIVFTANPASPLINDTHAFLAAQESESSFHSLRDGVRKALESSTRIRSIELALNARGASLRQQARQTREKATELDQVHEQKLDELDGRIRESRSKAARARANRKETTETLRGALADHEKLKAQNAQHWESELGRKPDEESRLGRALARLSDQHKEANELAQSLRDDRLPALKQAAENAKTAFAQAEKNAEEVKNSAIDAARDEEERQIQNVNRALDNSIATETENKQKHEGDARQLQGSRGIVDAPSEMAQEMSEAQTEALENRKKDEALVGERHAADLAFNNAKGAARSAERDTADEKARMAQAMSVRMAQEAWDKPASNSLLAYLRENRPGWAQTMGRVVDFQTLAKQNVVLDDAGATSDFFGLTLDFDALANGGSGVEEREINRERLLLAAREAESAAIETLAEVEIKEAAAKREAERCLENKQAAQEAWLQHQKAHGHSKSRIDDINRRIKEHADEAKIQWQIELAQKNRQAKESAERLEAFTNRKAVALAGLKAACVAQISDAKVRAEREKKAAKEHLDTTLAIIHQEEKNLENDIEAALAGNGLSSASMKETQKVVDEIKAWIKAVDQARKLVSDWRLWNDHVKPKIPMWESQIENFHAIVSAQEAEEATLTQDFAHEKAMRKSDKESLEKTIQDAERAADFCEKKAQEAHAAADAEESEIAKRMVAQPHPSTDHRLLASELMDWAKALKDGRSQAEKAVPQCQKAFTKYASSNCAEFWKPIDEALVSVPHWEDRHSLLVERLAVWYEGGKGEQSKRALMGESVMLSDQIHDFWRNLTDFENAAQAFSNKLLKKLRDIVVFDGTPVFPAIEAFEAHIRPQVKSLPFWAALEAAVHARENWRNEPNTLPSASTMKAFRALFEALSETTQNGAGRFIVNKVQLLSLSGEVRERGALKKFAKTKEFENISSNGLSYLLLCALQLAFLDLARHGAQNLRFCWALDEMGELDERNTRALLDLLNRRKVDLVAACPDADPSILAVFKRQYQGQGDGKLVEIDVSSTVDPWDMDDDELANSPESENGREKRAVEKIGDHPNRQEGASAALIVSHESPAAHKDGAAMDDGGAAEADDGVSPEKPERFSPIAPGHPLFAPFPPDNGSAW